MFLARRRVSSGFESKLASSSYAKARAVVCLKSRMGNMFMSDASPEAIDFANASAVAKGECAEFLGNRTTPAGNGASAAGLSWTVGAG